MYHSWQAYNKGLTPRELTRVMNGKYKPPIDSEYARHGYTPEEAYQKHQEYCQENARRIEHLTKRNIQMKEQMKEHYELRNKKVQVRDSSDDCE